MDLPFHGGNVPCASATHFSCVFPLPVPPGEKSPPPPALLTFPMLSNALLVSHIPFAGAREQQRAPESLRESQRTAESVLSVELLPGSSVVQRPPKYLGSMLVSFFSLLPCAPRIFSFRRSRHGFLERGKLRATTCCAQKSFCACPCAHNSVRASTCTNLTLNPKTLNSKLSFLPSCRPALGLFSASCRPERAA